MEIKSPAGEFGFDIETARIEDREIVLGGKMGVWEAETHVSQDDFLKLLGLMVFSARFWLFVLRLPGYALLGSRNKSAT